MSNFDYVAVQMGVLLLAALAGYGLAYFKKYKSYEDLEKHYNSLLERTERAETLKDKLDNDYKKLVLKWNIFYDQVSRERMDHDLIVESTAMLEYHLNED